jgi:RNA polymerase sigma-70 factor (ECF subfamily)
MAELEKVIVENLNAFTAFARKRLNDPELAADVVQESLLKALKAAQQPTTSDRIIPWFYRILRRSIIDIYRRRDAQERATANFEAEIHTQLTPEAEAMICRCFEALLPQLTPQYRALIQMIDLEGQSLAAAAATLKLTTNNTAVRLHRARKQLRSKLEETCQSCSKHGCLDCTCGN